MGFHLRGASIDVPGREFDLLGGAVELPCHGEYTGEKMIGWFCPLGALSIVFAAVVATLAWPHLRGDWMLILVYFSSTFAITLRGVWPLGS
jgi:hypothetical protein